MMKAREEKWIIMNSEMEKRREEGREQERGNKTKEIRKYGAKRK